MNNSSRTHIHYAWKIFVACLLIKIGTAAFTAIAMGNFVTPIVEELGCQVRELTTYTSINAISMALLYTSAARRINSKNIGLIMGIASIVEAIGLALMSTYHSVYMFYISGAMIGIAQAFTGFVALPIVINMWFRKNTGTVLGIVVAAGNFATMFYSLISGQLIVRYGWRAAYLIMAVAAAIITVPAVFLIIKRPQEAGYEPYGEKGLKEEVMDNDMSEDSITPSQAFKLPILYIAWVACVCYSYGNGVMSYGTTFSTMELGQSTEFGSVVGVCAYMGGIISSLIVGRIDDKLGIKAGMIWGSITTTLGYMMMFLSYSSPILVYPAIFIVGLGSCMYMVQCPLLIRNIVGGKYYSDIWSRVMVINSLVGGGLYSSIGMFYDKTGTYKGAFIMAIALYLIAGILGIISIDLRDKKSTVK